MSTLRLSTLFLSLFSCGVTFGAGVAVAGDADEPYWRPAPHQQFDWQLSAPFDFTNPADILDLDLFDADENTLGALKSKGVRLVCYINVGAWEDWREDAESFPPSVLGKAYEGLPGERWLDIRDREALAPIIRARFDLCRAKGFDAIEPDNIDGYDNPTGFAITRADQVRYNLWLAHEAHARGLSIALKNAPELLSDLARAYDWALLESCHAQGWCAQLMPFINAGKAVFAVEYREQGLDWRETCRTARRLGLQTLMKTRELNAWVKRCE